MGWNGSGKECVAVRPTKATMSSTIRASAVKWMIAVLVCFAVCVAAVFVYSVQGNDAKKPKSGKSGGMIAEAKPAIGMRANAVSVRKIEHPKTVDEALTNIAERVGTNEANAVFSTLAQSLEMGASVAENLKGAAQLIRHAARVRAQTQAQKAVVTMTFPLLLLILPGIFIVLFAPLVIQFVNR